MDARVALLLGMTLGCHRREETTLERSADATVAASVATTAPAASAPRKDTKESMTPELKRVLEALRSGSGHRGEVRGTFADLRRWIGPDARDWPLPEMLRQLDAAGEIDIHVLDTDAGANPAFVLSAWKQ